MEKSFDIKGKKLTLTHYANTSLRATKDSNGQEFFPMYVKMVYNKRTILYKSRVIDYNVPRELGKDLSFLIEYDQSLIYEIVNSFSDAYHRHNFYQSYGLSTMKIYDLFEENIETGKNTSNVANVIIRKNEQEILKLSETELSEIEYFLFISFKFICEKYRPNKEDYVDSLVISWLRKYSLTQQFENYIEGKFSADFAAKLKHLQDLRMGAISHYLKI
jgi:hypothetical protein